MEICGIEEAIKRVEEVKKEYATMDGLKDYVIAIETLLTAYEKEKRLAENHKTAFEKQTENLHEVEELYEKEKEKNKELTERVLKLESDKFWDNVVSKSKIKEIIYPTPENEIPIEIQQSEMYKKLLKEVEE